MNDSALEIIEGEAKEVPSSNGQAIEIRSAFDISPAKFKAGLARRGKNRAALMEWLRRELKEGVDWGRIHVVKKDKCPEPWNCTNAYHFSKPSLWKSGAEKLSGMMGLRSTWPTLDAELDKVRGGSVMILLKCQLLDMAGNTVSEGIGARTLDQDSGDINKALKMAKKSSLIDAVLNAGGLSEVFTQDVEDMPPEQFGDRAVADPYQAGEDRSESAFPKSTAQYNVATHCTIGKEKGKKWGEVDDGYLQWICSNIDDKPDLLAAARKELDGRSVESQESVSRRQDEKITEDGRTLADFARALTACKTIDMLTALRDEIPLDFEPALRTYITTREAELLMK